MFRVMDFHTHAFPDALADRAIQHLEREAVEKGYDIRAFHAGKVSDLLRSMDEAGIERSVICSIATRPGQFEPILKWSGEIRSPRIEPFPSFHPASADYKEAIRRMAGEGFRGVKFHPYYQDFALDEPRMMRIYEALIRHDLIIVMHTGYDIAFERVRLADPAKIVRVYEEFPGIRLVTTHMGAWMQWEEVREMILGRPIYMEISFALETLGAEGREFIMGHPREYVLFGSDSPWTGQRETLELLRALELPEDVERAVLYENAARMLG